MSINNSALLCFGNPNSVIQRSPTSGVFGSSALVGDKEGFVQKVIAKWYLNPGNTVPCESSNHLCAAEALYDFYLKYRKAAESTTANLGEVLLSLYRTGSISEAVKALDSLLVEEPDAQDALLPFVVLYTDSNFNVPEGSLFWAEDSEHAEEQFENENPDGNVIWIVQTACMDDAFNVYHRESTAED